MIRKKLNNPYVSRTLDILGVLFLASYLVFYFFANFIIEALPMCIMWADIFSAHVRCGNSIGGKIAALYFDYFSPLVLYNTPFTLYGLYMVFKELSLEYLTSIVLQLSFIAFCIFTSLRMTYKIISILCIKIKTSPKTDKIKAVLSILFIVCPLFLVFILKILLIPPHDSKQIITVDMWHGEISFPRYLLEKWSLFPIKKTEEARSKINYSINTNYPYRRNVPFIDLNIAYKDINPSLTEDTKIKIGISPFYDVTSNESLHDLRNNFLQKKIKTIGKGKEGYSNYLPPITKEAWHVYELVQKSYNRESSTIYVHRDNNDQILNIVTCPPDDCHTCLQMCTDRSIGTPEFIINYSFPKIYLDNYFDRHQKIINFIYNHAQMKK